MGIAIVTGASSGLGQAYAKRLERYSAVDEIWIVARRRERLDEIAVKLGKPARVLSFDLSQSASLKQIESLIEESGEKISYLINAAGFGKFGMWDDVAVADGDRMIDLDCRAAVDMCVMALPYMDQGGRILNVCSCAAFVPLQGVNIYAASKAFLLNYSRALRWEVASRKIVVTAVCPCWMKTEFMEVGQVEGHVSTVKHFLFPQRPSTVAAWSLWMNKAGLAVATCGVKAFLLRIVGKFIPHCVTMLGWEGLRRL